MFISLSKMLGKTKFRIGAGLRITKNNVVWMSFVLLFIAVFQMMWYMCVLCFWVMYAICYGIYWLIKKLVQKLKR